MSIHLTIHNTNAITTYAYLSKPMNLSIYPELTFSTNGHEFDSLAGDEIQGFVHISNLMEPHLASGK